jgi:hypothetical protein
VYVGQFLAKTEFIDQLQSAARACGAKFVGIILTADVATLQLRQHPGRVSGADMSRMRVDLSRNEAE